MHRRILWNLVFASVLTAIFCLATGGVAHAQNRKGMKHDNKRGDGNRDGKDTVAGAIWELTATKAGSSEQVSFRYRIADFRIYDVNTGKQIGFATLNNGKSVQGGGEVTFFKNSPFPSKFPIRFQRLSHWKGEFRNDKTIWSIKLACIDR